MQKKLFVTMLLVCLPITCFGISVLDQFAVSDAVKKNDVQALDRLLEREEIATYFNQKKDKLLRTVIVHTTSPEMLNKILSYSPNVNLPGGLLQSTPLEHATLIGTIEFMKILLHAGADPTIKNNSGALPLHTWLRSLRDKNISFKLFREIITAARANGLDINGQETRDGDENATLLQLVIKHLAYPRFVQFLLGQGADPTIQDSAGRDAFSYATDKKIKVMLLRPPVQQVTYHRNPLQRFLRLIIINDQNKVELPGRRKKQKTAMLTRLEVALAKEIAPIFVSDSVVIATLQAGAAKNENYSDDLLQNWEVYEYQSAPFSLFLPKKEKERMFDEWLEGEHFLQLEEKSRITLEEDPLLQGFHTRIETLEGRIGEETDPQARALLQGDLEVVEKEQEASLQGYRKRFRQEFQATKKAYKQRYENRKRFVFAQLRDPEDEGMDDEEIDRLLDERERLKQEEQTAYGLKIYNRNIFIRKNTPYLERLHATKSLPKMPMLPHLMRIFMPNKGSTEKLTNGGIWVFHQAGHGSYTTPERSGSIANMSVKDYQKEILFFNEQLNVARMFLTTCYAGSVHSMIPFVEASKRAIIKPRFDLYYNGVSDTATFVDKAYLAWFTLFEEGLQDEKILKKMYSTFTKANLVFKRTTTGHVIPINIFPKLVVIISYAKVKSHQLQISPQTPQLRADVQQQTTPIIIELSEGYLKKLVLVSPSSIPVPLVIKRPNRTEIMSIAPGSFLHVGAELDFSQAPKQQDPITILRSVFFDLGKKLKIKNRKTYLFNKVTFYFFSLPINLPYLSGIQEDSIVTFHNVMISSTKDGAYIYFEWNETESSYYHTSVKINEQGEITLESSPSPITRQNGFETPFLTQTLPETLKKRAAVGYLEEYTGTELLPRLPGQEDLKKIALIPSLVQKENWIDGVSAWDYVWFMTGCHDDGTISRLAPVASKMLEIPQANITETDIRTMFDSWLQKKAEEIKGLGDALGHPNKIRELMQAIRSRNTPKIHGFHDEIAQNPTLLREIIKTRMTPRMRAFIMKNFHNEIAKDPELLREIIQTRMQTRMRAFIMKNFHNEIAKDPVLLREVLKTTESKIVKGFHDEIAQNSELLREIITAQDTTLIKNFHDEIAQNPTLLREIITTQDTTLIKNFHDEIAQNPELLREIITAQDTTLIKNFHNEIAQNPELLREIIKTQDTTLVLTFHNEMTEYPALKDEIAKDHVLLKKIIQLNDIAIIKTFKDEIISNPTAFKEMIEVIVDMWFEGDEDADEVNPYVDLFIDFIPEDMFTRGEDVFSTPLCDAIDNGYDYFSKKLIERSIGINKQPKGSESNPLSLATALGSKEITMLLLKHPKIKNVIITTTPPPEPITPVTPEEELIPFQNEREEFGTKDHRVFDEALLVCVVYGWLRPVELLIDKGANYRYVYQTGKTALHIAAAQGHHEIVKLLVAKGLSVHKQDNNRKRPIDWARDKGHGEVIAYLEEQEAERVKAIF